MEAQGLRVSGIRFNEFAWLRIWVQSFRFGIRVLGSGFRPSGADPDVK